MRILKRSRKRETLIPYKKKKQPENFPEEMSGKLTAERKRPGKAIVEHQPEKRRAEDREKIEIKI